ncbi:integrase [Streptomyces albogriseolus]|uniref:Integrase n=1 Tax=Streptomyces albogriseolus TaxID=1887 RepID=A0ACC6USE2_STRAO
MRLVPIPPQLVAILRQHLDTFGTAEDGRLFTNERGGVVGSSTYYRVWQEARALAACAGRGCLSARGSPV